MLRSIAALPLLLSLPGFAGATADALQTVATPAATAPAEDGIPVGTAPEAAEAYRSLTRSMRPGSELPVPLASFEVRFELIDRAEPDGRPRPGSIETIARVRWKAPRFVSLRTEDKREIGYGNRGYYLVEPGQPPLILSGREYKEDQSRINSALSLAKNFARLADLSNAQVLELTRVEGPPAGVMPQDAKFHRLEWLEIVSPDFGVVEGIASTQQGAAADRIYRVRLGYLPARVEKGEPLPPVLKAMHVRKILTRAPNELLPTALPPEQLILLEDVRDNGGFVVPHHIKIYSRVLNVEGLQNFKEKPDRELWLMKDSRLGAPLEQEQFQPPE